MISTSSLTVAESLLCACMELRAWEREHEVNSVSISKALVNDKKYFLGDKTTPRVLMFTRGVVGVLYALAVQFGYLLQY